MKRAHRGTSLPGCLCRRCPVEDTVIAAGPIDRWTVLTLVGAGAFMVWGAGHYTVFDDEAFSCRRYVMPVGEMVSALWHGVEPDPPLYYVLENGWVRVFGVGPLGLRSLSILFFLAGLVFIRLAGQAWFDRTTGRVAMLLCAMHPAHLFFGFAARWYSLMFLLVAVLLWVTRRLNSARQRRRQWALAWALAAAAVCYANYFGPAVVGLTWLVGFWRERHTKDGKTLWIGAGAAAIVSCAAWMWPFWRQVTDFEGAGGTWAAYPATAARTVLALLTGNLASITAWWAWMPMGVFGVALILLLVRQWRIVWPIGTVVLGCFLAGVLSRTMIDKYVMTFSGIACLLAAALLVRGLKDSDDDRQAEHREGRTANSKSRLARPRAERAIAGTAAVCLVIGWAGCGVNLMTQRHWSSLRWLDPFEKVTMELHHGDGAKIFPGPVMSHPSARYYSALLRTERRMARASNRRKPRSPIALPTVSPSDWRVAFDAQETPTWESYFRAVTPAHAKRWLDHAPELSPVVLTLQTTGFASSPHWEALQGVLDERYVMTVEDRHLEDPDATWKDRLDPKVKHPRWRIVVRRWERRDK